MNSKWDKLNKELDDALDAEFGSEETKQETLEEAAENRYVQGVYVINGIDICEASRECFIEGAKWAQERMYSEENVLNILVTLFFEKEDAITYFEQFKKK